MDQKVEIEPEQSMCVLLPHFRAMKQDIFLDILKKTVARVRLSEDSLCSAFLTGLSATKLTIEIEDMPANMTEVGSKLQEIRVSKLLGFWAASNFPSLAKKLLGDHWTLENERRITIGDQQMVTEDLDAQTMKKLKLRVIELTVSHSTRAKIKHFIAVPRNVCKNDSVKISKKMNVLNIRESLIENCWLALRSGKYLSHVDSENQDKIDVLLNECPEIQSDSGSESMLNVKRPSADICHSVRGPQLVPTAKKPRVDLCGNTVNNESGFENLQSILEVMGNDITKLTYLVASFKKVEESQEMLQNSLAENDALRKQLTTSLGQSEQKNLEFVEQNNLMLEQVTTMTKNFTQSEQKNLDLIGENEKMVKSLDEWKIYGERMQNYVSESDRKKLELVGEIDTLRSTLNDVNTNAEELKKNFTQSEQKNLNLIGENEKMVKSLDEWKIYGERMQNFVSESDRKKLELVGEIDTLRSTLNDVNTNAEELKKNFTQSEQKNLDLIGENEKMVKSLDEWKNYGERMQNYVSESDQKKLELVGEIDTLRWKLNDVTTNAEKLKTNLIQSEQKNVQLVNENGQLWQRMNELKKDFDKMVISLQSQIQNIGTAGGSTNESDKENVGQSSETFNEAKPSLRISKRNQCRPKTACTEGNNKR